MDRKKYIIEVSDDIQRVMAIGVAEDKTVFTCEVKVDALEELTADYINEHYGELQDEAYQRGLEDAWNVARKIAVETDDGGVSIEALYKMFGTESMCMIMKNNTVHDATDKLKAYEDKQKDRIEVGDIVERYIDGKLDSKGIYLQEEGGYWRCLFDTGAVLMTFAYPKGQFKKTGKHYDIASILEAMRA